jgi:hypothetical protein
VVGLVLEDVKLENTREVESAGATESEKEEKKKLAYEMCIEGKLDSAGVWKRRCGLCSKYCAMYRERREIGIYLDITGRKSEVINEQSERCFKYGHKRTYHWCDWKTGRVEVRNGTDRSWRKIE